MFRLLLAPVAVVALAGCYEVAAPLQFQTPQIGVDFNGDPNECGPNGCNAPTTTEPAAVDPNGCTPNGCPEPETTAPPTTVLVCDDANNPSPNC